ncbi:hypothetical protein ACJJTC_012475 [Scirpophaga incertulas]
MDIVTTITNLCLGALAFGAFTYASMIINILPQYGAHIILVAFGYVIIVSQAVLSLTTSGWGRSLKQPQRRTAHFALQVLGCTAAISGGIVAIANSNPNAKKSVHGVMGITTLSVTMLTLLGGIFSYLFPESKVKVIKIVHSILGSITLILAFTTVLIALHRVPDTRMPWAYTVCAIVALIGILLSPALNHFRRLAR